MLVKLDQDHSKPCEQQKSTVHLSGNAKPFQAILQSVDSSELWILCTFVLWAFNYCDWLHLSQYEFAFDLPL